MDIILDNFNIEKDSIDSLMCRTMQQILFDEKYEFDELTFTTQTYTSMADLGIDKKGILDMFLLPYLFAKEPTKLVTKRLNLINIDPWLLQYFINDAYFGQLKRMAEMKAQFYKAFGGTASAPPTEQKQYKSLKFAYSQIESFNMQGSYVDLETTEGVGKFLESCGDSLKQLTLS